MFREKIIAIATQEIGTKESPPGSNRTKYGAWYGFDGYAWCAQFVSWVYDQAGSPLGKVDDPKGYRDCQSAYNHWKASGEITTNPQPGDIVLYDWNGDGRCDHTGIFQSWIKGGSTFNAIEGNTAAGNDSDGGMVMLRQRNVQFVRAFVSPKVLGGNVVPPSSNLVKGDKGSAVADLQKMLYDLGYPITVDGDFGNETFAAVEQFQKDRQLQVDGIGTPSLIGLLQQAIAKKEAPDKKITTGIFLKKGSSGAAVVALQKALIKAGAEIVADGVFGNDTYSAVVAFQKDQSLKMDGIAGPETQAALGIG